MFEKRHKEQPVDVEFEKTYTADFSKVESLKGYEFMTNMLNYVGLKNAVTQPEKLYKGAWGYGTSGFIKVPSLVGYICQGPDVATENGNLPELIIAFRGTCITADWANNVLGGVAADKLYVKGRVHQGFYNILRVPTLVEEEPIKVIDTAMAEYYKKHKQYPPRVVTTGHSLGGALATIAAAHIATKYNGYSKQHADYTHQPLQTYTFAAPRVGDADLCSYFLNTLGYSAVQVKNLQDPVPLFAPAGGVEWGAAFTKMGQMLAANWGAASRPGVYRSFTTGTSAAADDDVEFEKFKIFEELACKYQDSEQLQRFIKQQQSSPMAKIADSPASRDKRVRMIEYAQQLLNTLKIKWSDNPAPLVGVFESKEDGKWGGHMHSLEVYLSNIKRLQIQK